MQITKAQAVPLIAQALDGQRQEGETDLELVQRIRNTRRQQVTTMAQRRFDQIDEQLKKIALTEYYKANPDDEEIVEDLD